MTENKNQNQKPIPELEGQALPQRTASVIEVPTPINSGLSSITQDFGIADYLPLPFDEKLFPSIFRENIMTAPKNRKVPIMLACFAPIAAIDCRIRMRYPYDRHRLHAPLLQIIFEAPPGTGKSSFSEVRNMIIEPTLEKRDKAQRRKEQEYRARKKARSQNENIGEAPKTTIRCIPPATSKTVILERADYYELILGDTMPFEMHAEELALVGDARKSGFSDLRAIMRISYDLGAKYGQDYASENSYSAIADIQMCAMFCGTPADVNEIYTDKEVSGGNCSRVILVSLEDQVGAAPAHYEEFTKEQERNIASMLDLLMLQAYDEEDNLRPTTQLDMSWLYDDIENWRVKICDKVKDMKVREEPGYKAIDAFRKRAPVNAFRCTAVMYHMYHLDNQLHGKELHNEAEIRMLCRKLFLFLSDFCLISAVNRWGEAYERQALLQKRGAKIDKRKPLLDQATDIFTRDQMAELMVKNGQKTDVRIRISEWKANGEIVEIRDNVYQKTHLTK